MDKKNKMEKKDRRNEWKIKYCKECRQMTNHLDGTCLKCKVKSKEEEELNKYFRETGIPRCFKCHKKFENAVDSITGKINKHLWKPTCDCMGNEKMRLVIG